MPTYEYLCIYCNHKEDVFQSFKDDPLSVCSACGQTTFRRVISGGLGFFDVTPKTLGGIADRNAREMRRSGIDTKSKKQKKKKPWWRDKDIDFNVLKNPDKFIAMGET